MNSVAPAEDAAITIVETVDRRVVLVVAPKRGELECLHTGGLRIFAEPFEHEKLRKARKPYSHTRCVEAGGSGSLNPPGERMRAL